MARNDPQVNLRIPAELKSLLDNAAEGNKRSLTAEIVGRLERSFTADAKDEQFEELKRLLRSREQGLIQEALKAGLEQFRKDQATLPRSTPKKGQK